jgi:hypothetical protein
LTMVLVPPITNPRGTRGRSGQTLYGLRGRHQDLKKKKKKKKKKNEMFHAVVYYELPLFVSISSTCVLKLPFNIS